MTVITTARAWRCPVCGRATPVVYRCLNWDCMADLAGRPLDPVTLPEGQA